MLLALVICALAAAITVSGQDCAHATCNIGLIHYYKELNCVPVQESGACCPSKFDCSAVLSNRARNQCHVGGRAFDIGARLTKEQTGNKCVAECRCTANGLLANLNCANIECPEHMGMRPPPGCSYAYDHEHCCSVGVICNDASRSAPFTCNHGGHSHQLAEKFYPDEKPCMACICQEGFDGTLREPWCKEISCGIEVHHGNKIHEGCAPIHYGANGCCPIDWRCPKASDTVTKSSDAGTATGSAECAFGNLRLKIGDKLNSAKSCVECKCTLPPQVSCVQNGGSSGGSTGGFFLLLSTLAGGITTLLKEGVLGTTCRSSSASFHVAGSLFASFFFFRGFTLIKGRAGRSARNVGFLNKSTRIYPKNC